MKSIIGYIKMNGAVKYVTTTGVLAFAMVDLNSILSCAILVVTLVYWVTKYYKENIKK
jgi:hypothetical protein